MLGIDLIIFDIIFRETTFKVSISTFSGIIKLLIFLFFLVVLNKIYGEVPLIKIEITEVIKCGF
jgi:hypothetical protein